jgi:hypothetical protein
MIFSLPCQRQCELLPSLGVRLPSSVVRRPLTFHIDFPIEFLTVRTVEFSIFHFIKRILNMPKMY